ncbi:MAG: patatin-like phospholipase family protein [Bacteroidales bacterium]
MLFFISTLQVNAQKVALVLSGGGAKGATHIGVLRALEENGIPINYIAGTSMGAIIGGLYAAGYSPDEMQYIITSEEFKSWISGKIDSRYIYFFRKQQPDASWFTFKFRYDSVLQTSLPTNIISPVQMDVALMEIFSSASAVAAYNFDNLFVPFRCVASDIAENKPMVMRKGDLGTSIRASMTFPFYFKPIRINGKLLFDGGMYNNFPSDVAYNDFNPDIIIGSKAASNYRPPDENDILSQIQTMLMEKTEFKLFCDNGVLIEPRLRRVNVTDFSHTQEFVDSGYVAAIRAIPAIRSFVTDTVSIAQIQQRRKAFNDCKPQLNINNIHVNGVNKNQNIYINKSLLAHYEKRTLFRQRSSPVSMSELKPEYFKLIDEDRIDNPFPRLQFDTITGLFDLYIDAKRENKILAELGGLISSSTTNEIFLQAQYNYWGKQAVSTVLNGYFGRFHNSANLMARIDFPANRPFYIETAFTGNQWNYFRTTTYFFDDKTPSYVVEHENYFSLEGGVPTSSKGKVALGGQSGRRRFDYYQVNSFSRADTTDKTYFDFYSPYISWEINSLNRKQYASQGVRLYSCLRFISGREKNDPGSTSSNANDFVAYHNWAQLKLSYENFFMRTGRFSLGFLVEGVLSSQDFFHNYTSTILISPDFAPLPEMKTMVMPRFHTTNYSSGGLRSVMTLFKNIDFRMEGYVMLPFREILNNENLKAVYGAENENTHFIASTSLVYQSPLGPVSLSLSYIEHKEIPYSLMLNLGYLIFNKRSLE